MFMLFVCVSVVVQRSNQSVSVHAQRKKSLGLIHFRNGYTEIILGREEGREGGRREIRTNHKITTCVYEGNVML